MQPDEDGPAPAEAAEAAEVCEVWPEHLDALRLFLACLGQLGLSVGGAGGAIWRAAQAVNVQQELRWLGIHGQQQARVVRQYRQIEQEALRLLNEREAAATRKS